MIPQILAPHILSAEALSEGFIEQGYYCYEEDADKNVPLRELYDKGILKRDNDYFTSSYVNTDRPDMKGRYTSRRVARRKYEEKNKELRKERSANFQTMIPRELYEEINVFLTENGKTKVDFIKEA